jgi:hypothetical protein
VPTEGRHRAYAELTALIPGFLPLRQRACKLPNVVAAPLRRLRGKDQVNRLGLASVDYDPQPGLTAIKTKVYALKLCRP